MFSSGQMKFAIFFVIIFIGIMIYVYRKDMKLHRIHYKGAIKVLLAFLLFIVFLFVIKAFLKK
ncbi:MAG: hypothetical protein RBR78_01810 [Flavobacteriaceae bacterium]|nr:hypothetical protein [Flavobacteriaceae bacterium]